MRRSEALHALKQEFTDDQDLVLLEDQAELSRCSRDAYEYSPVLTCLLYTSPSPRDED